MKTVIIVSKCQRVTKINSFENWYHFHFKGVCAGEILKKICLRGAKELGIKKGEEYLIYLRLLKFEEETLMGEIIKIRPINDCWDRS